MADDATGSVLSEMTPQPAANPDAQTTVNDFLDYTEFFPSDLHRSLRLIGDLDAIYSDATLNVHDLTKTYGRLPDIPASERPDPVTLRKQIALSLDKAIYCRESTFAEASRLYEVAERHVRRLSIIKAKLQALPQPPSRDPTPAPVSPTALKRGYDKTPRLHIHFDSSRYVRPIADRGRKPLGRGLSRGDSESDSDSDVGSTIDLKTPRRYNDKTPKSRPPQRARPAGPAAISTSSALAMLSPPPPDARPGSKFAPWFKLTEYEMAVLRKQMKKNALWTPSDTMIRRELEKKQRGHEFYEKEKARCEATGEEFLDEEPYKPSVAPLAATPAPTVPQPSTNGDGETLVTPVDPPRDSLREDTSTVNKGMKLNEAKEAKKVRRESQREQAIRDAQELEDATKKIKEAAEGLKELTFSPDVSGGRRRSSARPYTKRKRDSSPTGTAETPRSQTRETSHASQDSGTKPPEPKRLRLQSSFPVSSNGSSQPALSTPLTGTPIDPSPVANTPVPFSDSTRTTTINIPLAPAGPGTPKAVETDSGRIASPALPSAEEPEKSLFSPTLTLPTTTAASLRPRRESLAPAKAASPAAALLQGSKTQKTPTPAPEPARASPILAAMRPRSARGHVPTPKAQSEEPKPNDIGKPSRELRRHSIFSQSAIAAPTRASSRKKPPPKGDITSAENGSKTVTNVKRAQGSKNKKKKKADEENEPPEDIDPDEPRYCICDDVSFGQMISCDNNCEKEWFHLECVGMTAKDIPGRRAKWYCPDCRKSLGTDMYGNPLVPPSLPGRRGAR